MNRLSTAVAAVIIAILLAGVGVMFWTARPQPDAPAAKFTEEDTRRLFTARDKALANLENEAFAPALEYCRELTTAFPSDPFGWSNGAIARHMALMAGNPEDCRAGQPKRMEFDEAIAEWRRVAPKAVAPHLLLARVMEYGGDSSAALFEVNEGLQASPDSLALWMEKASIAGATGDAALEEARINALEEAFRIDPENLSLLTELLPALAQAKRPSFVDAVARAQELLKPFAESLKVHHRIDVEDRLSQAAAAAANEEWPKARVLVLPVCNVLRPEPLVQADQRRLRPNALEFVTFDLLHESLEELPPLPVPAPIEVTFDKTAAPFKGVENLRDWVVRDVNLDGRPDVLALTAEGLRTITATAEKTWQSNPVVAVEGDFTNLLSADLDDDVQAIEGAVAAERPPGRCHEADSDAILFGPAGLLLVANSLREGELAWEAKPAAFVDREASPVKAAALVDLDHDGDLDVAAVSERGLELWSNRGNLEFVSIVDRAELPPADWTISGLQVVDWDRDLDLDLILFGPQGLGLLENVRHGRFRFRQFNDLHIEPGPILACTVTELNGDASWDLLVATKYDDWAVLTGTTAPGSVVFREAISTPTAASQFLTWDYDNDGWVDVLARQGNDWSVWRGLGNGHFEFGPDLAAGIYGKPLLIDLDGDHDLDVLLANDWLSTVRMNNGGSANDVVEIALRAQQIVGNQQSASGRVNHLGIGSLVELRSPGLYQAQIVSGPTVRFGVAKRTVDAARVVWTNGIPRNLLSPTPNELICEEQTLKGSCPYLYTWNGEQFVFCTDLLWAAPLGLKFAEDFVAPWRNWEHLKVDGRHLRAVDGEYRLRVTEELWEAAYFDQIELTVVDHPAGTVIETNEKVGPAELATPKLHVYRDAIKPTSATTKDGRDVLTEVLMADDVYARPWSMKLRQGLTDEHWLELSFPPVGETKSLKLLLTGWVYPSDTSINVALSQNPDLPSPEPPSLWIPAADGTWEQRVPFLGFPGGKTKTIVVDVSDVVSRDDPRLRIRSTMQFAWDAAALLIDEEPIEVREVVAPLKVANLRHRGVSARDQHPQYGPERPNYAQVLTGDHWPPMTGPFTEYGDALDLLAAHDDRLVTMAAGDELELIFTAPPPPPEGWTRDFVLKSVGWDKDADMNTVYGEGSLPLPWSAMEIGEPEQRFSEPERSYRSDRLTRFPVRARFWNALSREQ
jgi:hypothetical protein